jgi:MarR family 2-MHQ and catechol resistance regulon transcriptional repressor
MQVSAPTTDLEDQAMRLHRAVTALVKRYQFRDRHEICRHGVSVSQCYALEALGESGSMTMGELAAWMHLTVSTMTRIVNQLVARGLVERSFDPQDRRVWRVSLTGQGEAMLISLRTELLATQTAILGRVPADHRETVIGAIDALASAVDAWRGCSPRRA